MRLAVLSGVGRCARTGQTSGLIWLALLVLLMSKRSAVRPELARLVLAMVKPVRLVWPRLDDGLTELELHFILGGSVADAIEAMPARHPALRLLAAAQSAAADDVRRYLAQRGARR